MGERGGEREAMKAPARFGFARRIPAKSVWAAIAATVKAPGIGCNTHSCARTLTHRHADANARVLARAHTH